MTTPSVSPQPVWPIRAGLVGALVVALAVGGAWLAGLGLDIDTPDGWLLIGAGTAGWLGATAAGCFGPLPSGASRNVVLDAAIVLSTVSVLVLAAGIVVAVAAGP